MLAWYHDIEQLVNLPHMSTAQRQTFIASHATEDLDKQRQSGSSSPGLDEDEADAVPYSQVNSLDENSPRSPERPLPGGSFPSETKLDNVAMYSGHSPTTSDVTNEHAPRLSREEDVAAVFGTHDLERPDTHQSAGSIGDDRAFSTAAVGAVVGATAVGGAMAARGRKDTDLEDADGKAADPHEAVGYYGESTALGATALGATSMDHQVDHDKELDQKKDAIYASNDDDQPETNYAGDGAHEGEINSISDVGYSGKTTSISDVGYQGESNYTNKQSGPGFSLPSNYAANGTSGSAGLSDAALGAVAGGAGVAGISALYSHHSQLEPNQSSQPPTSIETQPPVDKDVVPAALNGSTSPGLSPPNTIRRSKSKKEIVEETLADSIGNHPERGILPGFWPDTPAQEITEDGAFRRVGY
jgi:hypothetical protein